MPYVARVPSNASELETLLTRGNTRARAHLEVNEVTSHLEVDLERPTGVAVPLKRSRVHEAAELVKAISAAAGGPTGAQAAALYDLIDPQGR